MKILKLISIHIIAMYLILLISINANGSEINIDYKSRACIDSLTSVKQYLSINSLLKKYDSPLVSDSHSFVSACKLSSLNCYLLPSIAGLESRFGKYIIPESHNPFGWGKGLIPFNSWRQSILTVGSSIKTSYIDQGLEKPYQIARKYAPDSTTWYVHIDYFMNTLYNEQVVIDRYLSIIQQI